MDNSIALVNSTTSACLPAVDEGITASSLVSGKDLKMVNLFAKIGACCNKLIGSHSPIKQVVCYSPHVKDGVNFLRAVQTCAAGQLGPLLKNIASENPRTKELILLGLTALPLVGLPMQWGGVKVGGKQIKGAVAFLKLAKNSLSLKIAMQANQISYLTISAYIANISYLIAARSSSLKKLSPWLGLMGASLEIWNNRRYLLLTNK